MMLDRLGRMMLIACTLPAYARSKVTDLQVADQVQDGLCDLLKKVNGERDEARHNAAVLRDELRLASAELDGYRADVQHLTDRAETSERHLARAMRDGNAAVAGWAATGRRVDALQATLDIVYPIGWAAIIERDAARACLTIEHEHALEMTKERNVARIAEAAAYERDAQRAKITAGLREDLDAVRRLREADSYATALLREELTEALENLASMERKRDWGIDQANALRAELAAATKDIEWLRRETGWPDGNDASWLLNQIADKDEALGALRKALDEANARADRLIAMRDAQGTTP